MFRLSIKRTIFYEGLVSASTIVQELIMSSVKLSPFTCFNNKDKTKMTNKEIFTQTMNRM